MKNLFVKVLALVFILACSSLPFEVVEETHENGSPKVVRYYKNESKEIILKEIQYHADSSKYMEGNYKNGERDGVWTAWYRNGNVWSTGKYKNGIEDGKKTVYHENGQKYYEGVMKDEKRTGIWTFWNSEGEVVKTIDYNKQ